MESPHLPFLPAATNRLFCVSVLCLWDISHKMWPFMSGFFHLVLLVQGWSMLRHFPFMVQRHFITWLYHTLFPIHQFMDIRVVSTFWLLSIVLGTSIPKFLFVYLFSVLMDKYLGKRSAGLSGNSMFYFLKKCRTFFQSTSNILCYYQQCMGMSFSPHPHLW